MTVTRQELDAMSITTRLLRLGYTHQHAPYTERMGPSGEHEIRDFRGKTVARLDAEGAAEFCRNLEDKDITT